MTTAQLKRKVRVKSMVSYGHYDVEISYRGKEYHCVTTNTLAVDCIDPISPLFQYYSEKQALLALYNECKQKNNLN